MIWFLLLQTPLNFMNAAQKRILLKKKEITRTGHSLYHAICQSRLSLHFLFFTSLAEYWFGTVIRLTTFCNYSKSLYRLLPRNNIQVNVLFAWNQILRGHYIFTYMYIFINTLYSYLSGVMFSVCKLPNRLMYQYYRHMRATTSVSFLFL